MINQHQFSGIKSHTINSVLLTTVGISVSDSQIMYHLLSLDDTSQSISQKTKNNYSSLIIDRDSFHEVDYRASNMKYVIM